MTTVQTTGVNLEGVLANAVAIIGGAVAVARVVWGRAKKGFAHQAEQAMAPTVQAVDNLTQGMAALGERIDHLEAMKPPSHPKRTPRVR